MKYFTPEHYSRGNSPNEADLDGIEDEWDRAIQRYNRRWRTIKNAFPQGVRRFEEQHVCLHDAEVLGIGREDDTFVFLLETEPPALKPVVLTFTLEDEPAITAHTGHGFHPGKPLRWFYEEWNLDRRKRSTFEVLLSNGWVVKLVFRDFHYLVAEPILPSVNGQAAQPAGAPRAALGVMSLGSSAKADTSTIELTEEARLVPGGGMAARKKRRPQPAAAPPTIHEATLAPGPSGAVLKGAEIDVAAAIVRCKAGLDIVVCGDNRKANRAIAQQVEAAVGPYESQDPHKRAGPHALPHFQPDPRPPDGHSFYETDNPQRKARRQR